ncbi:hypothetical protein AWC38_SpisGene19073, partial [Stylophora pistillata]
MAERTNKSPSDHLHDRVTCTYEVPPSSELQSIDPVDVQQTQISTELTVHLTLSQTESGLATYETGSDCKKESEHNDMDETNRKARSESKGCSKIQERERKKVMMVGSKQGIEQPPTLCAEKEEKKDSIYAVVHKERKSKVNSEANALKTSLGRPQEGASGLPVNKASHVDYTGRSSDQTDLGLDNIAKSAESETLQAAGKNEYLYAAVDMTTKKKKPPQTIVSGSTSPLGTKAVTIQGKTSTEQDIPDVSESSTNVFTPTTAKSTDEVLMERNSSFSPTVAAASLGAVLFVVLIILIVVILLWRKKLQGEGSTHEPKIPVTTGFKESTTRATKPSTQPSAATTSNSALQNRSTSNQPTK